VSKKPSAFSQNPAKARGLPMDFWKPKTLEELAAEQGIHPIKQLEEVLGQGTELWRDDAEFETFLAAIYESRRRGA
jgi:hypothetical protein